MLTCYACHTQLSADEEADPALDLEAGGVPLCDCCNCFSHHFSCCWCGSCGETDDQWHYAVVYTPTDVNEPLPGLYRLHPSAPWTSPWTWIGFLPLLENPSGEAYAALCQDCCVRAREDITTYRLRCMIAALH